MQLKIIISIFNPYPDIMNHFCGGCLSKNGFFFRTKYLLLILWVGMIGLSCTDDDGAIAPEELVQWENLDSQDGLISDAVFTTLTDQNGHIWVGTDEGIMQYDGEQFIDYNTFNNQIGFIDAITEDSEGRIYAGSSNGFGIFEDGEWSFFNGITGSQIPLDAVALFADSNDVVWLGTSFLGLLSFNGTQFSQFIDDVCGLCNDVNVFFEDSNGLLWIGTEGGLKNFDGNTFERFRDFDGLPNNRIRSLEEDQWGRLWIGTIEGEQVGIFEDGEISTLSLSNSFPFNAIFGIEEDITGRIWLGLLSQGGLVSYDGAVMRTNRDPSGPGDTPITSINPGPNNTLLVGTFENGLWIYTPN